MKQNIFKLLIGFAMLLLGTQAHALLIQPGGTTDATQLVPGAVCTGETACSSGSTSEIRTFIEDMWGVEELYQSNVGGIDEKAFASSYDVEYFDTPTDPSGATLTWNTDTSTILCPECLLLVKGGGGENLDPAWYLFDLGDWDGMEMIELSGFWPTMGAISHVSIYGGEQSVPEPGILALLGLGLVGMVASRRKVK